MGRTTYLSIISRSFLPLSKILHGFDTDDDPSKTTTQNIHHLIVTKVPQTHDALQKHLTGISAISPTSSTSPTRSPSRTRFGSLSSSPEANNAPFLVSNPTNIIP